MPDTTDLELGAQYPLTDISHAQTTKDKILLEATILFAQNGYAAVSIRDIVEKVSIKAASLYNHFESKEALWDGVLEHVRELYLLYFERLDAAISLAADFEEVLECMFVELKDIVNIFTYYGFALLQTEQLRDEKAYEIYRDILLTYSIGFIQGKFDECVQKGWVRPFETKITATFFMHSVLHAIVLRTHEDMGRQLPYNVSEMLETLQQLILRTATGQS